MKRDDLIADLRVQIGSGNAALVVGAGVSLLATGADPRASWIGLLRDGAQAAGQHDTAWIESVNARLEVGTIEQLFPVADEIVAKLTANGVQTGGLRRWLAQSVGTLKSTEPGAEVLLALIACDVPLITTNYDSLIEQARGNPSFVTWRDFPGIQKVLRKDSASVVHLHGHWEEPESVLLSRESYLRKAEHNVGELQKGIALLHSLVFVGVGEGMNDPDLSHLIEWASRKNRDSAYTSYRLCLASELPGLQMKHAYDNIEVVSYGEKYEDLPEFLTSLAPAHLAVVVAPQPQPRRRRARVDDLKRELVDQYAERKNLDPRLDIDTKLDALQLVDESGELHGWTLLCFARDPGTFFPGADLKLVNAVTKSVITIDGPLPEQVPEAMRALRQVIALQDLDDDAREQFFRTLREAISNAVVHRDYDRAGSTRVVYGRDAVRVHSPGSLPLSIDRTNVLAGVSQPPHRERARILQYLNAAEGAGLGFESFREYREGLSARFPGTGVTVMEEAEQITTTITIPRASADPPVAVHPTDEATAETPRRPQPEQVTPNLTPVKPVATDVERLPRLLTPVLPPRTADDGLDWNAWLETIEQRTGGLSAREMLAIPGKVEIAGTSQGWSRLVRDESARSLAEVLASKPLRAVINVGAFNFDSVFATIVAALWETNRYVGIVEERDVNAANLQFLLPENAAPIPVVVTKEPVRSYYPISDVSHEFVLVTRSSVTTVPLGFEASFWRIDRLREDAASRRLSSMAQGDLTADAPASKVLKKLIHTLDDVEAVNTAVRPLGTGSGSSVVGMLRSVEERAPGEGLDLAKLRKILTFAYPWAYPKEGGIDVTGEAIDRWVAHRESRFRWVSLIVGIVMATTTGALFLTSFGATIVESVIISAWTLLAFMSGLLARVRVDTVHPPWYLSLIPFLIVQVTFPLVIRFAVGLDLAQTMWMILATSVAYSVCRLIGETRISVIIGNLSYAYFYAGVHGANTVLDAAARLGILTHTRRSDVAKTPAERTVGGVKDSYSISSKTLFDWLRQGQ